MSARLVAFGLIGVLLAAGSPTSAAGVSDAAVNDAIRRGVDYLRATQQPDGRWPYAGADRHDLGMTALAGLALVENGLGEDDPAVSRATAFVLAEQARSVQTYDVALATLYLSRLARPGDEAADAVIRRLAARLDAGSHDGAWSYVIPSEDDLRARRPNRPPATIPDHSNTQFAVLGLWAAGRHGYPSSAGLAAVDRRFRSSFARRPTAGWGYIAGHAPQNAMTCAGVLGLAIAAARPELAERQTARARGAALAADPVFRDALASVGRDSRALGGASDIYYLWSLERVCVALGLRQLDGFDWYDAGARELLARQGGDGGWAGHWGPLPSTALALLFLRKANLAFELDRVLKLPGKPAPLLAAADAAPVDPPQAPAEGPEVVVTGASDADFPEIAVDFELRDGRGGFLLDAEKDEFAVAEEGRPVAIKRFLSPYGEAQPIRVVLVVDRSGSMQQEDRIGGLKAAVATFLDGLPRGSRVAVVAFGSEVRRLTPFTDDFGRVRDLVNELTPAGGTRFHDAVADALDLIRGEPGRRAVLALTDGEDTFSQAAGLPGVTASARRLGLPVYTLGLGSEDEIEADALRALAEGTRGQYYPAREATQLRSIYRGLAERLRSSYTVVYRSDRVIPDGTLRPVRVSYRRSSRSGETAVFIPGMVVPAPGWPRLFLALLALLAGGFALAGRGRRPA